MRIVWKARAEEVIVGEGGYGGEWKEKEDTTAWGLGIGLLSN